MDSFERQFGNNCGRSHHRRISCSDDWHQLVKRRYARCESRWCESGVCELGRCKSERREADQRKSDRCQDEFGYELVPNRPRGGHVSFRQLKWRELQQCHPHRHGGIIHGQRRQLRRCVGDERLLRSCEFVDLKHYGHSFRQCQWNTGSANGLVREPGLFGRSFGESLGTQPHGNVVCRSHWTHRRQHVELKPDECELLKCISSGIQSERSQPHRNELHERQSQRSHFWISDIHECADTSGIVDAHQRLLDWSGRKSFGSVVGEYQPLQPGS